ncbi:MAG: isoprenyl transferase [Eubacterium sp.]|nr:isoprenyl transferase [Eubacterium sp.]
MNVPEHVAIILDGNGRWAKSKGMPRNYGHVQGAKTLEEVVEAAWDFGVKYLTVYAFSTENWKRPDTEVDALMNLFRTYLKKCQKLCVKHNMRMRIIGDRAGMSEDIQKLIDQVEEISKDFTGLNLQIALNYGSRDEMLRGMKALAQKVQNGEMTVDEITEESFSASLDTKDIPDPDLLIRTSGEQRISNYLLWQLAYAELYFTDIPWPDFHADELKKALDSFGSRDRRFGGVK